MLEPEVLDESTPCAPHLYPLDEHEWEFIRSTSDRGIDVEYRIATHQVCTTCGWYVVETTVVETLISGGGIGDQE